MARGKGPRALDIIPVLSVNVWYIQNDLPNLRHSRLMFRIRSFSSDSETLSPNRSCMVSAAATGQLL
jgi:hypothetical protein